MALRHRNVRLSLVLILVLLTSLLASAAFAAPAQISAAADKDAQGKSDDLKHPRGDKQRALHEAGLEKVMKLSLIHI